jgi:hypothetical protein
VSFGGPHLLAPLSSMLGIRGGMNVSVLNPPPGFLEKLLPLPEGAALLDHATTGVDVTIFFTQKKTELVERLVALSHGMALTGAVWVCFPHALTGPQVPTEDFVRLAGLELGLTDTKRLLLDPAWTGLRLAHKPRPPRPELPRAEA